MAFNFVKLCLRIFALISLAQVTYKGLNYLPENNDPVVFVANHRGFFDFILLYPVLKGLTGPIGKSEFRHYPVIGWWFEPLYGIFLDRNDTRQGLKCILQGIDYLKSGISMMIFPEGKRGRTEGEMLEFHAGSFKLATKSGARIIPVAFTGTGDIFDDHVPFIKTKKVTIEFCEPLETKNLTREEQLALPEKTWNIIHERITANINE